MRRFALTSMILAASAWATPGFASSIELASSFTADGSSIVQVTCADCPPPAPRNLKGQYVVPDVAPGAQSAEVIDVDGKKKLKRVESWLGGSPVVFMTSSEGWATNGSVIVAAAPASDGVDLEATTAAVAQVPAAGAPAPINQASFELRLN